MTNSETEKTAGEKLVEKDVLSLVDFNPQKKPTKSRRKNGIIRGKLVPSGGITRRYYFYCIGKKEIYLGTAEYIQKAVNCFKEGIIVDKKYRSFNGG